MTRPTVREVVNKLTAEGDADQIALFFKERKVIGTRSASYDCPVSLYIGEQTGYVVRATPMLIQGLVAHSPIEICRLGGVGPVAEFMIRFDHEAYPDLDAFEREL